MNKLLSRLIKSGLISRSVIIAIILSVIAGVLMMLMLIEFDHLTSTEAFCTGCHSMELTAVPYRESAHYNSRSGVRADCGDCHVSEGVIAATIDHIKGTKDVFAQLFGEDYDDPVIKTLHLPEAAFSARRWFKKTNSATCKKCHIKEAIIGERAETVRVHREDAKNKTCIDCHINLVHRKVPGEDTFKREAWNKMVEEEFKLESGTAARLLKGAE